MMNKTAIILGATGATGNILLQQLLVDDNYTQIKLFLRRSTGINHPKIREFIGNIVNLEQFQPDFTGNEVFCCVGTTKAKTKDKQQYKAIDFGIPFKAAQLTKENKIPFFAVISALGANDASKVFYNRTKGEMEKAVIKQKIEHTYILRPSLIKAKRSEKRTAENIGNVIFSIIKPIMIGKLRKYRPIKAKTIANALQKLPNSNIQKKIILSDEIKNIADYK